MELLHFVHTFKILNYFQYKNSSHLIYLFEAKCDLNILYSWQYKTLFNQIKINSCTILWSHYAFP